MELSRNLLKKLESKKISLEYLTNKKDINIIEILNLYIIRNQITNYKIFEPYFNKLSKESKLKLSFNLQIYDKEIEKEDLRLNYKKDCKYLIENFDDREFLLNFLNSKFKETHINNLYNAIKCEKDISYFFSSISDSLESEDLEIYERGVSIMKIILNEDNEKIEENKIERKSSDKFIQEIYKKIINKNENHFKCLPDLILKSSENTLNLYGTKLLSVLLPYNCDVIESIGLLLLKRDIFLESLNIFFKTHIIPKTNLLFCYSQLLEIDFYIKDFETKFCDRLLIKNESKIFKRDLKIFLLRLFSKSNNPKILKILDELNEIKI